MVELLAPAGTPDALRAAVAASADAVYVGLGAFNARAANGGFSPEELERGCVLAHSRGARVYVTLNVCLHDRELASAIELAAAAIDAGADALIVADIGLCALLRCELPHVELHLSTQTGAQSAPAVRFAARELGVDRVTCARELSCAELGQLCAEGVPIEAFCHGAICICYSGACSYSALMRGRSANRGDCTQPCRLAYELQDGRGRVLAGGAWRRDEGQGDASPAGDRLLCPRDYLGIRHVGELVRAGVASLKIEGRMKGPDYVYNVVRCYRRALDAALAGVALDEFELDELEAQLARSFSRGFTDGYLRGGHAATGAGLMSVERAINQGLEVGCVDEPGFEGAWVTFCRDVAAGDMLEIRSTPGVDAPADVPKRWPIVPCAADVHAGERMFVRCKRKVEPGSAVHVVRSAGVVEEARAAVESMRVEEERLSADLAACGGEAPRPGTGELDSGVRASYGEAEAPCEDSCAMTPHGVPMPHEESGPRYAHARRKSPRAPRTRSTFECAHSKSEQAENRVFTPRVCTLAAEDRASCAPGGSDESFSGALSVAHGQLQSDRVIDLGEVCRSADIPAVRRMCDAVARGGADAVLCRNIGQVELARECGVPWEAAAPLNVWNAHAARVLQDLGARSVWLPEELAEPDRCAVRAAAADAGVTIGLEDAPRGSTPLMILEHCVLTAEGPCDHACAACPRRLASERGERVLVELDRKSSGAHLRVRVDELGRTRLYR